MAGSPVRSVLLCYAQQYTATQAARRAARGHWGQYSTRAGAGEHRLERFRLSGFTQRPSPATRAPLALFSAALPWHAPAGVGADHAHRAVDLGLGIAGKGEGGRGAAAGGGGVRWVLSRGLGRQTGHMPGVGAQPSAAFSSSSSHILWLACWPWLCMLYRSAPRKHVVVEWGGQGRALVGASAPPHPPPMLCCCVLRPPTHATVSVWRTAAYATLRLPATLGAMHLHPPARAAPRSPRPAG